MIRDPLLTRAREVWTNLADVPVAFPGHGMNVVVSAGSRLCPPKWVGIVVLGGAGIVTVPADGLVGVVRGAMANLPGDAATEIDRLRSVLPVVDVLGPATLAYLDEQELRTVTPPVVVEALCPDDGDLVGLLESVNAEEAEECGLAEITSKCFVVREGHRVVAAAGYRRWPGSVAHLSVLTAPEQRGRGLAQAVASAATADGLANQLLPQWRARPESSRRVARALGFRHLGAQLSIRVEC